MKIAFYSTKSYDKEFFQKENQNFKHEIIFFEERLDETTAQKSIGFDAICAFVNDDLKENTLKSLHQLNIKIIALRCSGFNNLDLKMAANLHFQVVNVPSYSPHAVAEHAVALMLALNRKIPKAYNRSREGNFSLDSLLGFDMYQKTAGIIGLGSIGVIMAQILSGFGCKLLGYDRF